MANGAWLPCLRVLLDQVVLTLSQCSSYQHHVDERGKHHIGLVIARKYTARLESAKQPLDFVATPIELLVQRSWVLALWIGRHHRHKAQLLGQFTRCLSFMNIRIKPTRQSHLKAATDLHAKTNSNLHFSATTFCGFPRAVNSATQTASTDPLQSITVRWPAAGLQRLLPFSLAAEFTLTATYWSLTRPPPKQINARFEECYSHSWRGWGSAPLTISGSR